jgi:hypothetical protein
MTKPKREEFRSEEDWINYQKDCRTETRRSFEVKKATEIERFMLLLKHDTSLVGVVVVIPKNLVHLRLKKAQFGLAQ